MTRKKMLWMPAVLIFVMAACARPQAGEEQAALAELQAMARRFAPTELHVETAHLSRGDRQALTKLIEAARVMDDIFLEQMWSGNHALHARLQKDASELGRARAHYFWINKGPWSALDEWKAFLPGVPARKPLGSNFYPEDMTREQFEAWAQKLPEEERRQATGFFSVIRRDQQGALRIVPYSEEYRPKLERAAGLLREAAAATENATLRRFLETRAAAFLSDDYYESDVAWMELDAPLDATIGPYEVYEDELFGYKAAFQAYISVRDPKETEKLAVFARHLQEIENNLPIPQQHRNPKLGSIAPLWAVNLMFSSGHGNQGVQTAAYNLPNDERVIREKGSKRVMLKNVQEAKFEKTLLPISQRALAPEARQDVNFDSFFTHILMHELVHGLGPTAITVNGRKTSPRQELKELYSPLEEAKADVAGIFALQYLMDNRRRLGLEKTLQAGPEAERRMYTTYLASAFRTLRFGLTGAHGRGKAVQINYLMDKGGVVVNEDGTFAVDFERIKPALRELARDLLMVQALGDYEGAQKMLEQAVLRPPVAAAIERMRDIPTDIEPVFTMADAIAPRQ
jgi:hypothetical protein